MQCLSVLGLLAVLLYHGCGNSDAADADCSREAETKSMTLKKQLLCSYDRSVLPVKVHTNTVPVSIFLSLQYLVFVEHYSLLEVHSWILWRWKDEHLTWDKSEHGGLDKLQLLSSELWTPDVTIYNPVHHDLISMEIAESRCTVQFDGNVTCLTPSVHHVLCSPDIRRWPFDSQACELHLGSWNHAGEEVNLSLIYSGISTSSYQADNEWELVDLNATRESLAHENNTYLSISYDFTLRRHPGGQASTVVIPAVELAVLTLVTFWLNPENPYRSGLIYVSIICQCLYMIYLGVIVPANGDSTPVIVTFFRDSLLLAALSLVVTVCAARMNTAARAPPAWVSSITDFLLALPGGQLLLGEDNTKGAATAPSAVAEGSGEGSEGWRLFSTLLDRVFFIVCFLTVLILLCAYVP